MKQGSGDCEGPARWQQSLLNRVIRLVLGLGTIICLLILVQSIKGTIPVSLAITACGLVLLMALFSGSARLPYALRAGNVIFLFIAGGVYILGASGFVVGSGTILVLASLFAAVFLSRPLTLMVSGLGLVGWIAAAAWSVLGLAPASQGQLTDHTLFIHSLRTSVTALLLCLTVSIIIATVLKLLREELDDIRLTNQELEAARQSRAKADAIARQQQQTLIETSRLAGLGQLSNEIGRTLGVLHQKMAEDATLLQPALSQHLGEELTLDLKDALQVTQGLIAQLSAFGPQSSRSTTMAPVAVHQLIHSAHRTAQRLMPSEVEVRLTASVASDLIIQGDSGQLLQVLTNLIINARDAMPNGGVLHLHAEIIADPSASDEPPQVLFHVSDTGVGMPQAIQARIFDPFFSTKGPDRGNGLGLATAYSIAHQHQGLLAVESTPGEGSTFTLTLPSMTLPMGAHA